MKIRAFSVAALLLGLLLTLPAAALFAQSGPPPRYIPLGGVATGALYTPASGKYSYVGIVAGHPTTNTLGCGADWAGRGFLALCFNTRYVANETAIGSWETMLLDVKAAINFMKTQPGITKIVLMGSSGGGALMTTYQAVAENGPPYCQEPNKIVPCSIDLAGLPRADGIILNDSVPGYGVNGLRYLDPSVVDEARPDQVNSDLDPYDPKNGFNPKGSSTYSAEFKERYHKAQADRMNRLVGVAQERLRLAKEGKGPYKDDDVFVIGRGETGPLFQLDLSIADSTVKPQKLLKNDGTVVTQIVKTIRLPAPSLRERGEEFGGGAKLMTLRSFLAARAIRAKTAYDFDISSNNNSTAYHLQHIAVPLLVVAAQGHYFMRDNEVNFEAAASADKDFVVIEGAAHMGPPCVRCEQTPGQYGNSLINQMNYMASWAGKPGRF